MKSNPLVERETNSNNHRKGGVGPKSSLGTEIIYVATPENAEHGAQTSGQVGERCVEQAVSCFTLLLNTTTMEFAIGPPPADWPEDKVEVLGGLAGKSIIW